MATDSGIETNSRNFLFKNFLPLTIIIYLSAFPCADIITSIIHVNFFCGIILSLTDLAFISLAKLHI